MMTNSILNANPVDAEKFEALRSAFPDLNHLVSTLIEEVKQDKLQSVLPPIDLLNVSLCLVKLMTVLDTKGILRNFDQLGWIDPRVEPLAKNTEGWILLRSGVAVRGLWDSGNQDHVFFHHFTKLTEAQKERLKGFNHAG